MSRILTTVLIVWLAVILWTFGYGLINYWPGWGMLPLLLVVFLGAAAYSVMLYRAAIRLTKESS